MENFLLYIGKSGLAAGAFYLLFLALFQNKKQFLFNRIYLPVSLAISFLIPLITFTSVRYIETQTVNYAESYAYLPGAGVSAAAEPEMEWTSVLFLIYLAGTMLFLGHLLLGHYKAFHIVRTSKLREFYGTIVNVTSKDVHPFSFFNKIVLSEKTTRNPNLEMIVLHESIHVKERHTLDILAGEVLFLFQWFNPFAWLIKDAMKNNLEYLTDHQVAQSHNPEAYQLAMVGLADKKGVAPFLTALNGSQLKNRIIMMKQKSENKYPLLKQLVVLPLLAVLIMGLSNKEVKTEFIESNTAEVVAAAKTITGKITDEAGKALPGTAVFVKGTTIGTITDMEGNYELKLEDDAATLVFMMIGFDQKEVKVNKRSTIDVKLSASKENEDIKIKGEGKYEQVKPNSGDATQTSGWKIDGNFDGTLSKDGSVTLKPGSTEDLKISATGKNAPLFIVDGKEYKDINALNASDIESISVLKDATTRAIYGEKAKNGVVLISTKSALALKKSLVYVDDKKFEGDLSEIDSEKIKSMDVLKGEAATNLFGEKGKDGAILITTKENLKTGDPLYFIDGKRVTDTNKLDTDDIESISVLKGASATALYGSEIGKNGVIFITTKSAAKSAGKQNAKDSEPAVSIVPVKAQESFDGKSPLVILDGKEYKGEMNDISPGDISSISVLKDEAATELYGDAAKDGVIIIQTHSYKIKSMLEMRKFIAQKIKYPLAPRECYHTGDVNVFVHVDAKGRIALLDEKPEDAVVLDEVVVTGYGPQFSKKGESDVLNKALKNEAKRVVSLMPAIDIPELIGKNVIMNVKFRLQ
ncbi:hypothetical protein D1614_08250 [Maribellus luteus]|uniref:M56 family peptidase n=1 Tax=Maribellus luteus TaxID=2305463 RepID=A0A399T368_9BACT|nr:M56 family metallopeptidase [Maribellus luteus]RIJ49519.1 hypothetical protein D1614_08250 [Maribellus luteus]